MEQTSYASGLRYLDADDLDDSVVEFDDLDVVGTNDDRLGELDGFLVEHGAGTVRYLVVDSGGWFTSRRFLLPAEHVTIDREAKRARVEVSKGTLRDYPDFDEDRFGRFSDEEYHAYQRRLGAAWPTGRPGMSAADTEGVAMYRQPDWWSSVAYTPDRLRPIESRSFTSRTSAAVVVPGPRSLDVDDRHSHGDVTHSHPGGHEQHTHDERELVTARERDETSRDHDSVHESGARDRDDVSPYFGGRAQPGDILGLETGGETTAIGDSAEDENKRRRAAEKAQRSTRED